MATPAEGDWGAGLGPEVTFDWKWYHYFPGAVFWMLLVVLLAVFKTSREREGRVVSAICIAVMVLWQIV